MTHNGLIRICAVSCSIGVSETVKGFTVAGFDGFQPCLLDRKAKTCMVESDKRTNSWEIKTAGMEKGLGGLGSESQGLGNSVLVANEAGVASIINGTKPLAVMELVVDAVVGGLSGVGLGAAGGGDWIGGTWEECKKLKLAALLRGPGSSCWSSKAVAGTFGRFVWSGKHQRWGACCPRHPLRMLCPLG